MFTWIWLLFFWMRVPDAKGLKISHLSVPRLVDVRSSASLTCDFDLESSKLYSVKWYKDDLEFCRFMPDGTPEVQIFQVEGVHVRAKECSMTSVILNPLEFSTSGLYTCEVSTEAPYFKTVQTALNMTVLGIPKKSPVVTGLEDVYAVGDYVAGNCTSDASHPPADIDWYINENRVESWQLESYPEGSDDGLGLKASTLGIFFQVDHSHFSGKGNTMVLECYARVGDISKRVTHISKLADLDVEKFAQELYGNRGHAKGDATVAAWMLIVMEVLILRRWFENTGV